MQNLKLNFGMSKNNGHDFTQDEIDQFMNQLIELAESKGYSLGGGIVPED